MDHLTGSPDTPQGEPVFEALTSRGFTAWLASQKASIGVTTYQVGKMLFFGTRPDGKLWVFNRTIGRCLGLAFSNDEMWVTNDTQVVRYVNALSPGTLSTEGHDALYLPQQAYFTGDLDIHDMAIDGEGNTIFVNTLFNCLARPDGRKSFVPVWKPPFISRLAAEDRCHLNGLAMREGKPAYVTAIAASDTYDGWRGHRQDGGIVIDVATGETVVTGMSMPHSPRWHDGRLWLHNSGTGEFGYADFDLGRFRPVAFCPGYLRGLTFIGNHAVMGLSKPRDNRTFSGLPLDYALASRKMEARCGLYVVDLASGDIAHTLVINGIVTELYDTVALHGHRQPAAIAPGNPELSRMISIG